MQLNQPVQNPAFISKLKQFDSNKTRKDELELIEEMRKMRYITPVTLTGKSEDGTPNQQTQVKFRAATTTKGESFFAMFSDMDELKKWAADAEDTMTLDFSELRTLVPVSYTHLDVYKRQVWAFFTTEEITALGAKDNKAIKETMVYFNAVNGKEIV